MLESHVILALNRERHDHPTEITDLCSPASPDSSSEDPNAGWLPREPYRSLRPETEVRYLRIIVPKVKQGQSVVKKTDNTKAVTCYILASS